MRETHLALVEVDERVASIAIDDRDATGVFADEFLGDFSPIPAASLRAASSPSATRTTTCPCCAQRALGRPWGTLFPRSQEAADVVIGSNDTDAIARLIDERVLGSRVNGS